MDTFKAEDGTTYTMDTAPRYTFVQARRQLHDELGRKWGAYALYHAGMEGSCTVGGTTVTRVGNWAAGRHEALYTITDA